MWDIQLGLEDGGEPGAGFGLLLDGRRGHQWHPELAHLGGVDFLGGSINFVYSSFICFNIIFDEYKRISVSDSE